MDNRISNYVTNNPVGLVLVIQSLSEAQHLASSAAILNLGDLNTRRVIKSKNKV